MRPRCCFCGAEERCEVFELWDDGCFQLDACCDGFREELERELAEDPKAAARLLAGLPLEGCSDFGCAAGVEQACGRQLRRVVDAGGQLLLDWQLELVTGLAWAEVRAFIGEHHEHNEPPRGWRFGAGIRNGGRLIGVVSVGRAVARAYKPAEVVEANRVCIRRDIPRELAWNACSMLYGWAAREAKKRGFRRIISYTLQSEPGTSLIAAGFKPEAKLPARRRGWDAPGRPRDSSRTPNEAKIRWARELAPRMTKIACTAEICEIQ